MNESVACAFDIIILHPPSPPPPRRTLFLSATLSSRICKRIWSGLSLSFRLYIVISMRNFKMKTFRRLLHKELLKGLITIIENIITYCTVTYCTVTSLVIINLLILCLHNTYSHIEFENYLENSISIVDTF